MSLSGSGDEPAPPPGSEAAPAEAPAGATPPADRAPATGGAGKPARTRTGAAFNLLIAGAIVLILLLVFILENTSSVKISYFGASAHLPLGVAVLIAAIGGALLTGAVGAARILQLRRHVRRRH